MRVLLFLIGALAFATALSGCGMTPAKESPPNIDKDIVVTAGFDEAWAAAVRVLTENEWAIETMEKSAGVITTDFTDIGHGDLKKYGICPTGTFTSFLYGRYKVNILFSEKPEGSCVVTLNVFIEGHDAYVEWQKCNTTGALEREVLSQISQSAKK